MQRCDVCLDLDRFSDDRWKLSIKADLTDEYSFQFESSRLGDSVDAGCENCSIVKRGLELISRNLSLFDVSQIYRGRFILQPDSPLEVEILNEEEKKEYEEGEEFEATGCARVQFYTLPGKDLGCRGGTGPFSNARDVLPELSAEKCSSIAFDWITRCRTDHEACTATEVEANNLPRRLLDLKQREGAAVALVETQDDAHCHVGQDRGLSVQYATLSHCWGKAHVIQTTKENLALRMQGIEWAHLPKTFQDAITIVRALDIRFLWIDSLCIVQDDVQDWKEESVRMAIIYSNGYINIAATGASDSRGGCLSPRSLKHVIPTCDVRSFAINVPKDPQESIIFVRPSLERTHQRYSSRRRSELDLPDSQTVPLLSRAWVFQERHLAPRTLHFHPSEMIMECKSSLCCECSGLDNVVARVRNPTPNVESTDRADLFTAWFDVVEEYSKLRLTRQSDRLPALTGVASVFQRKIGCGYLAGIWKDDIARSILWDVTRYECIRSERSVRRHVSAPTWSWASLTLDNEGSGIMFPAGHDDTFRVDDQFRFVDTDVPFAATDLSIVGAKFVLLHGLSATATAHPRSPEDAAWKDLVLVFEQDVEDAVLVTAMEMDFDCTWKSPNHCPLKVGCTVYCLLVGNKINTDWESGQRTQYQCALVLRQSVANVCLFERVGVISIVGHSGIFQRKDELSFKLI
ncbi:heterokaryon incompatibility protein-domain-containing protein [Amylocarpus encephaloides]|uniref:Heterokaryon incompatibility protein-domain-containing protein n=1 Tax=Amylocarpus encephaloides TaxID=45428 RepID=A0A9P7YA38_9HELO|nr:heterokaryon incompatibility protein-domain-containing protein [Amylocarpus encephaloides]